MHAMLMGFLSILSTDTQLFFHPPGAHTDPLPGKAGKADGRYTPALLP